MEEGEIIETKPSKRHFEETETDVVEEPQKIVFHAPVVDIDTSYIVFI